ERPTIVSVQAEGCAPLVRAFEGGHDYAPSWTDVRTLAPGLRAPVTIGDYLILGIIRESGGIAVAVGDEEMLAAMHAVARLEGLSVSVESAATYAAAGRLLARGFLRGEERVVAFNTAAGFKHAALLGAGPQLLDPPAPTAREPIA